MADAGEDDADDDGLGDDREEDLRDEDDVAVVDFVGFVCFEDGRKRKKRVRKEESSFFFQKKTFLFFFIFTPLSSPNQKKQQELHSSPGGAPVVRGRVPVTHSLRRRHGEDERGPEGEARVRRLREASWVGRPEQPPDSGEDEEDQQVDDGDADEQSRQGGVERRDEEVSDPGVELEAPAPGEHDAALPGPRSSLDERRAEGALSLGVFSATTLVGGPRESIDDGGDGVEAVDAVAVVVVAFFFFF